MKIMVVGLGYVGSVAATGLAKMGHEITGVDKNAAQLNSLLDINSKNPEPGLAELTGEMIAAGRLDYHHVDDIKVIDHEIVVVCVGTPAQKDGTADLSQIKDAIAWILHKAAGPFTLVMRSTVPPGTGENYIRYFKDNDMRNYYVMNPEFLREGQAIHDWFHPDRIVIGGLRDEAVQHALELYKGIDAPVVTTDVTTAEMIKYASNAFLATKVSFINEIARLCERVGADIDTVARGTGMDKRIGTSFFKAGLGYGGSCFPKDTHALHAFCTANGFNFELLKAVIEVNSRQRKIALQKIKNILGGFRGKTVAVLGLSFKPGTDDIREAPALEIIRDLCAEGAAVRAYDPAAMKNAAGILPSQVVFCRSTMEALEGANAVLLATEWDEFINLDWTPVKAVMQEPYGIIDGRNALPQEKLTAAGFKYTGIGRSTGTSFPA